MSPNIFRHCLRDNQQYQYNTCEHLRPKKRKCFFFNNHAEGHLIACENKTHILSFIQNAKKKCMFVFHSL